MDVGSDAVTWRLPTVADASLNAGLGQKLARGKWKDMGYDWFWNVGMKAST